MKKYYPNMYKKSIYDINYKKLKKIGIKYLVYDLDNTIALINQDFVDVRTNKLFNELKKDFTIIIISNNNSKRVKPYAELLDCDYIANALKPSQRGLKRMQKRYNLKPIETCMIGDQIMTDIKSGNSFGATTILVDPLGKKDLKITTFNRFMERQVIKSFNKKGLMMKGKYYE